MTIYHRPPEVSDTRVIDPHQDTFSKVIFGFWTYLMTDCLLFGTLFATYGVLHSHTYGGPTTKDLFDLPLAFVETLILLTSSLTCGLALLAAKQENKKRTLKWLGVTFLLGLSFIACEFTEFHGLIATGHSWQKSAFLSSFFALVGTHGLHVTFGLLLIAVLLFQVSFQDITTDTFRRLVILSLFWHFLDLIWVFIFTVVYLMGVI